MMISALCIVPSTWYDVEFVNGVETFYDSKNGTQYVFIDGVWKLGQWMDEEFITQE